MLKLIGPCIVGSTPEVREYEDTTVTSFSVASHERWKTRGGDRREVTTWFRMSAWGNMGETIAEYIKKGERIYLEAVIKPDEETGGPRLWEGDDGTRASYEAKVVGFEFLGGSGGPTEDEDEDDGDGDIPW
jgi:single-strand DNA-binding protein